jgi:regulatory protein
VALAAQPSSGASSSRRTGGGRGGSSRREGPSEDAEQSRTAGPPADPVDVARQICLHQLEFAPRTRAELAAVLRNKGIEDDVADEVLRRFTEVGMIDDAVFAQMWVTSRHRGRGLAGRAL